jgi:AcrR family transcriptional regulator
MSDIHALSIISADRARELQTRGQLILVSGARMTLYRHFPSKEALFEGLVTAMCEYMRDGLENAPSANVDKPAVKRLADELRAFTSALIEPDALALYRLIVAGGWRFPALSRVFDQSACASSGDGSHNCSNPAECLSTRRGKLQPRSWQWC